MLINSTYSPLDDIRPLASVASLEGGREAAARDIKRFCFAGFMNMLSPGPTVRPLPSTPLAHQKEEPSTPETGVERQERYIGGR